MIAAEELLKPISEEAPCGPDLSDDGSLQELETLAQGEPERMFDSPAKPPEPPDWKEVWTRGLKLFGQSKDLRVVIILCVAGLELEGMSGLREVLAVLKGLLERYWATVHPQLDPSDNNDPLQRMNIIASLAMPVGTFGDPFRVLERLRATALCNSVQMGRYGLADIVRAETGAQTGDKPGATMPQIEAAFRDSNPEELSQIFETLGNSIGLVQGIDEFITRTVGAAKAPDLAPLSSELVSMQERVARYLPAAKVDDRASASAAPNRAGVTAPSGTPAQPTAAISGEIRSRADVVKILGKICDYYAQAEPSSPVPLVLKRAARLVDMDFLQIVKDLSPDALAQVRNVTGETNEG
jgi:type VI secretion system protein ImpA